jgi:hypothetical protein
MVFIVSHHRVGFRVLLGAIATLTLVGGDLRAHAQAMMRSPSINIPSRAPTINPGATLRAPPPHLPGVAVRPILPTARYSPNLQASCSPADRSDECLHKSHKSQSTAEAGRGGAGKTPAKVSQRRETGVITSAGDPRTIANELVAEIDGSLSADQADALARRYRLQRVSLQNFPLIGATIGLFRITDRRSVETVRRTLAADARVRSVQPNYRYALQEQAAAPAEGDPAQYALAKLRLPEAHKLAQGSNVTIAVIDSGVDLKHPEFVDASFDAFDAKVRMCTAPALPA